MNPLLERLCGPSLGIVLTCHCTQYFSGLTLGRSLSKSCCRSHEKEDDYDN